ncbi:hypothetical protein [Gloeothece verrucosa]|uniref:DUF4278 domain-containing protein n=1 Tax=Gloeothece verrucosa (strain PCC 7822) TaxID=497965 RepID=E0UKI0_GLOV7|nr:hypothetical protein [Gloeothece verrucosa]ADN17061.1 hypothetical protein Cyan7822_5178 [Gloeothece verrucosa PCC 7822]
MSYVNIFPFNTVAAPEKTANSVTTLIYRGQVYQGLVQTQKRVQPSKFRKVKLIYRGQTYHCLGPVATAPRPRAINWRFQVA